MAASAHPAGMSHDSSFFKFQDDHKIPAEAGDGIDSNDITLMWIKDKCQSPEVRVLLPAEGDALFPLYEDGSYVSFLKERDFSFDDYEDRLLFYCVEKPARQVFRALNVGLDKCLQMTKTLQIPGGFAMAWYDVWLALVTAKAVSKVVEAKRRQYHHRLESEVAHKIVTVLYKNYVSIKEDLDRKIKRKFEHEAEELQEDYEEAMRATKRNRTANASPLDF